MSDEALWPRIELKMVGDWGVANFHTLVGMIAANMRFRSEPRSRFWILTGTGFRDSRGCARPRLISRSASR